MYKNKPPFGSPDWRQRNESDGNVFYGYDDDSGHTTWYTEDGTLDCETRTPNLDDLSTEREIDEGYLEDLSDHKNK